MYLVVSFWEGGMHNEVIGRFETETEAREFERGSEYYGVAEQTFGEEGVMVMTEEEFEAMEQF